MELTRKARRCASKFAASGALHGLSYLAFGCAALLASASAPAEPVATIRWLINDFPPYEIASGPDRGQGMLDQFRDQLIKGLPQYRHVVEYAGFQRRESIMKSGALACATSMFRTPERELVVVFAQRPYLYLLPVRVVVSNATAKTLAADGVKESLSLPAVAQGGKHSMGVYTARHYGPFIDHELVQLRQNSPSFIKDFHESYAGSLEGILSIMERGRFDMTLGYTVEGEYLRKRHPQSGPYTYLPIAGADALLAANVGCSRTSAGQAVIKAIDARTEPDAASAMVGQQYMDLLTAEERKRYVSLLATHK